MTCSKDYYLVVFIGLFEAFEGIGSDVDASLDSLTIGEGDINHLITWIILNVIDAVN
jgi:hypothetical protein